MKVQTRTVTTTTHTARFTDSDDNEIEVETSAPVAEHIDPFVADNGDIIVALVDTDGSTLDTEYEWPEGVEFIQGNDRHLNHCDNPQTWLNEQREAGKALFMVGVYEHGLVQYTLAGESIHSGDQWDYCVGAAIAIPQGEDGYTDPQEAARAILAEYTAWCNGEAYGIATLSCNEAGEWEETDTVWGFLGSDHAEATVKSGGY